MELISLRDIYYTDIECISTYSKHQAREIEPMKFNVKINALDEADKTIVIGEAHFLIYAEEVIAFELEEGYEDRQTEAFKAIEYLDSAEKPYFDSFHPQTMTAYGKIAYFDRISITKDLRGNGFGSVAMKDILLFLSKYTNVEFVVLFPYPFEWDKVDEKLHDKDLIAKQTKQVESFYEKLGFEFTYGVLDESYMCMNITELALLRDPFPE